MIRKEQIEQAARENLGMFLRRTRPMDESLQFILIDQFKKMAEWADENPAQGFYRIETEETLRENSAIQKLAIAMEALDQSCYTKKDGPCDCVCCLAMDKIEKMNGSK